MSDYEYNRRTAKSLELELFELAGMIEEAAKDLRRALRTKEPQKMGRRNVYDPAQERTRALNALKSAYGRMDELEVEIESQKKHEDWLAGASS